MSSPPLLPRSAAAAMPRLPSEFRRRSRSPSPSNVRRRSRSPPPSRVRRRSRSPPPSKVRRRSRSPSKFRRRYRSPPYVSATQCLGEPQRAKRPSAEAAVEGERARPSSLDESLVENGPSQSHSDCKHSETSAAAVEKRPDPANRGDEQEFHTEKMDGKNQSGHKAPSRNARRKKIRRQVWTEAKKQIREMKKDKLLEKIKKLEDCVWLLEKDGEDMAEIKKVRSLLKSTQKQYEENEELLAQAGSSASQQLLNSDRLEKTPVETMAAPVEKVEGDEQIMYSGETEGGSLEGCKAVPEQSELAEEANRLKSEIETVRQDHDYQLAQAQSLMADVAKQKEVARMYGVELEDAMRRVAALEEESLLQNETIRTLQVQLASANEKLTVPSPTRD